jgi:poly(3-hydroxybutyrate) depolymerase
LRGILEKLHEEKGIGSESVYVGGFSMGGGMALQLLARHPERMAGVFGLGSFLATDSSV